MSAPNVKDPLPTLLSHSFSSAFPSPAKVDSASDLCAKAFPSITYTEVDRVEIQKWLSESNAYLDRDETKHAEKLKALNNHLSSRTTLLGSKPSPADLALFARLAPIVSKWTPEQQTGEHGHHHLIRYLDYVQNAPCFGLSLPPSEKLPIDPSVVLFIPKRPDTKEEKERKKKEKGAAPTANPTAPPSSSTKASTASAKARTDLNITANDAPLAHRPKKEKGASKNPAPPAPEPSLTPSLIDLRVGHILKAIAHPNADSLYVSTIACGDPSGADNTSLYEADNATVVRTVCSGLNGLVPLPDMQDRLVVVVCNLKPVTMRGVKSAAMVLAASPREAADSHAGPVELVRPPKGAKAGDKVKFEGWEGEVQGTLNPKKKVWERCQAGFGTDGEGNVVFEAERVEGLERRGTARLVTGDGGVCSVESLKGALVR
ncbi:MAG: G4 quadruplex nucleic acid binding protein [Piccolia ochrophora]|nr:MAG: G4 quadruplex nucleic acid binding protein [Piccolia ochrophora]